jgi:acetoin utilization protein AcuB
MTKRVATVRPDEPLVHAHVKMQRLGCRHLPVVEFGELVGILSDRDVLRYSDMRDEGLYLGHKRVREAMTKGIHTCRIGDRLGDIAAEMINRHIDALPVVDDAGQLVGIITSTDLLSYLRRIEGVLDSGAAAEAQLKRIDS